MENKPKRGRPRKGTAQEEIDKKLTKQLETYFNSDDYLHDMNLPESNARLKTHLRLRREFQNKKGEDYLIPPRKKNSISEIPSGAYFIDGKYYTELNKEEEISEEDMIKHNLVALEFKAKH